MDMNTRLPHIRPLSDLRVNMGEITDFLDQEQAPVVLTKHGRGKYVLLRVEDYSELIARKELYQLLDEGLDDIAEGARRNSAPQSRKSARILPVDGDE